ncbi:hypothetical protein ACJX0J_019027, partial [Zea mays]
MYPQDIYPDIDIIIDEVDVSRYEDASAVEVVDPGHVVFSHWLCAVKEAICRLIVLSFFHERTKHIDLHVKNKYLAVGAVAKL